MNTKFFKYLFIALFLTAFSFGLKAQDDKVAEKWEFATIYADNNAVNIVQTNAQSEKIPFTKSTGILKINEDFLKAVQAMVNDGWIVIEINSSSYGTAYLKRKLK